MVLFFLFFLLPLLHISPISTWSPKLVAKKIFKSYECLMACMTCLEHMLIKRVANVALTISENRSEAKVNKCFFT